MRLSRSLMIRGAVIGTTGAAPMALVAARAAGWWFGVAVGLVLCALLCVNVWLSSNPAHLAIGLPVGLTLGFLADSVPAAAAYSVLAGSLGFVVTLLWLVAGSAWGRFCVVRAWLAVRGVIPWRLFGFLE